MTEIYEQLYQFTQVMQPIRLSIHQYLLMTGEPILIQTGSMAQARETLPQIRELLNGKRLKHILVSHFESDECGGLSLVLKEFPEAVTVCSEVTARQLAGFGITSKVDIKKPGERFQGSDFQFDIIAYPSEMHLWEGILFLETTRGIFFSSDLMFGMGETHGQVVDMAWDDAIQASGAANLPAAETRDRLLADMKRLKPSFVASGHGPCIRISRPD